MSLNGVDVGQLNETVESITKEPGLAQCRFRTTNRWVNGCHNYSNISDFYAAGQTITHNRDFKVEMDEPPVLLGEDAGANPVEYILSALSGCLTTALIYHAAAQGIRIDEVESTLEGDLDIRGFLGFSDKVRNGYNNIRVTFQIKSDAPQEKLDDLVKLAQVRSPVFDIVSNPVTIDVQTRKVQGMMH
jgi:uncharacterized OsmC-like protein